MKIATVILTYGESPHLDECLASLKSAESSGIDNMVLVVDNSKDNAGFSGGNNKGISRALSEGVEAVLILNDDTKIAKSALSEMAEALNDKQVGLVVPKIYFYPGFEYHKDRYRKSQLGKVLWYAGGKVDWDNVIGVHRGIDEVDRGQFDRKEEVDFATGCSMMISRRALEKVGLLDEKYFMYLEDLDYSVRVRKAGFKIMYEPRAIIWHKNAQSSGVGSELHDYFFTRNRLLFGFTHASLRTRLALLRESGRIMMKGNKWKKQGVIDFYLRRFGKGSWK